MLKNEVVKHYEYLLPICVLRFNYGIDWKEKVSENGTHALGKLVPKSCIL